MGKTTELGDYYRSVIAGNKQSLYEYRQNVDIINQCELAARKNFPVDSERINSMKRHIDDLDRERRITG